MTRLVALVSVLLLGCSSDSADSPDTAQPADSGSQVVTLELVESAPATAEAGTQLSLTLLGPDDVQVAVAAGGGSASVDSLVVSWTLGVAPIPQKLEVTAGDQTLIIQVDATLATPLSSEPWGDVHTFLTDQGADGSTEDLVFAGDRLIMGAPGGLMEVDASGKTAFVPLTGQSIVRGWGVAVDGSGDLWTVDSGAQLLLRIDGAGEVHLVADKAGEAPWVGVNDVEVGPQDRIYISDPCLGRLSRWDPAAGEMDAHDDFDLATEGGPNGMTFDADGNLYVSTENTVVLCDHPGVAEFDTPLGNLYKIPVTDAGFGAHELIEAGVGVFGDGLTFDADGNLYGVFDTLQGLGLDQSKVVVFPGGRGPGRTVVVAGGMLYANVAFGTGAYGETQLYLGLLSVPLLVQGESRGLERVDLGVTRAPWLR
ncbi:MAG: sugar lactone lactonase YvrE [Myxococcota bacterium]|jgi:sugar lactone lactonase YvrE